MDIKEVVSLVNQTSSLIREARYYSSAMSGPYRLWEDAGKSISQCENRIKQLKQSNEPEAPETIQDIKKNEIEIKQQTARRQTAVEEWTDPLLRYIEANDKAHETYKKIPQSEHVDMGWMLDDADYRGKISTMLWQSVKMMHAKSKIQNARIVEQLYEDLTAHFKEKEKFRGALELLKQKSKKLGREWMDSVTWFEERQKAYDLELQTRMEETIKRFLTKN